ncbi:MAG: virulence RhuM family protein [Nitrospirae bacterium]|nr:virulence RhuM family protein [Nitrospirota bacterium]MBF0534690.1 virulence RhuM family protein [Nitrospirota bacterium]MBF0616266.1 virulence RhuM family protein [Nitrospirota bacterium]
MTQTNGKDKNHSPQDNPERNILIYKDGALRLQVRLAGNTVWLTQRELAELYQTSVPNVNIHISSIFEEGELSPEATIKKYLIVQIEGKRKIQRDVNHYNLDMILAVGYRVRSQQGTRFRQWATQTLKEYIVKGFVLDDERLKEGRTPVDDYFDELLERIRSIRASERRFYQKITDIYSTSIDYEPNVKITLTFYATVQNKLHWAIHGQTAAEVIKHRADAKMPNMGLTTWKNAPHGQIRKTDITIAKNYLTEDELRELNRIVNMYLDYAELQAKNRKPMHMSDWVKKLDAFLEFNEQNILTHAGKVSHELAQEHSEQEFEKFEAERRLVEAQEQTSDFDRVIEDIKQLKNSPDKNSAERRLKKSLPTRKPTKH